MLHSNAGCLIRANKEGGGEGCRTVILCALGCGVFDRVLLWLFHLDTAVLPAGCFRTKQIGGKAIIGFGAPRCETKRKLSCSQEHTRQRLDLRLTIHGEDTLNCVVAVLGFFVGARSSR